ncbi:GTP cyclohydrolase FolE2 [compost metagenome]
MNAPEYMLLPDVQASADSRALPIQRVGVRDVRYPLSLLGRDGVIQHTVARLELTVALPEAVKGTHMSRFLEFIEAESAAAIDLARDEAFLDRMLRRLDSSEGRILLRFPYFLRKAAPVSGITSLLDVDVALEIERHSAHQFLRTLKVTVPVTSLCPCSKEISAYGAHNQRSHLTISVTAGVALDIESLVRIAEEEASCQIYGLLKRADEKWVTEKAYENPKFVEDLVRDIALRLRSDARIDTWSVASENFESIHNHSAYARIEGLNLPR